MGTSPIFNLLCNHPKGVTCEIPQTLPVLSSSLAKATRFAFLRSSPPLSTRLLVVKSSLRSVLRCARNTLPRPQVNELQHADARLSLER